MVLFPASTNQVFLFFHIIPSSAEKIPMFTALFSLTILSWIQIMEQMSLTASQLLEGFE